MNHPSPLRQPHTRGSPPDSAHASRSSATGSRWIRRSPPNGSGRLGFDYVAFDAQHGLIGYDGLLRGLMAVDAGHRAVGVVRVGANDQYLIGRALDAGAVAVIVPLIDNAEQAAQAIRYTRYAPTGVRSYGPMRSALRIGPNPAEAHEQVAVLAMIETADGLANVEEICAVPGLAGVYIGPYDLRISLGGSTPTDPALDDCVRGSVATGPRGSGVRPGWPLASTRTTATPLPSGWPKASPSSRSPRT